MAKRGELRQALIDGNVDLLQRMWRTWFPTAPQPANWQEAQIQLHLARTASRSVPLTLRCYSHHWLKERSIPSLLPDRHKASADQLVPKVTPSVGFAWGTSSAVLKPAAPFVQDAVSTRINEMHEDGLVNSNPDLVRNEIILTKNRTLHSLFGHIGKLKEKAA
jgi:hypothetical protein